MIAGGKAYIPAHGGGSFKIYNFFDLHYWNEGCAIKLLKKTIEEVKNDDRAFWIGGGDWADAINYHDPRYKPTEIAQAITRKDMMNMWQRCCEELIYLFTPIKHKGIAMLMGNHEETVHLRHSVDMIETISAALDVKNLGYCGMIDVIFQTYTNPRQFRKGRYVSKDKPFQASNAESFAYRFAIHHGAGYAQTQGARMNRLVHFMGTCEADLYVIGHLHEDMSAKKRIMSGGRSCNKIIQKISKGMYGGTYLKTYWSESEIAKPGRTPSYGYGEKKMYSPAPLGSTAFVIQPKSGNIGTLDSDTIMMHKEN